LFDLQAETFEACLGVRMDDVGEIGDVASGVNVLDVFGGSRGGEDKKKENEKKLRRKRSRSARKMGERGKRHATTTIGGGKNPVKRG
jgi:hypothetical protein